MREQLRKIFGDRFKQDEPLSKHVLFRVGGPAKFFVTVQNEQELISAIEIANKDQVSWMVLGGGSNAIASDQGFDGLVIKIGIQGIEINDNFINVGAGVPSVILAKKAAEAGLSGLEWAVSLPGSVGGAIRGNAGCFGGETKETLKSVRVFRDGNIANVEASDIDFGYRDSSFKKNNDVILSAEFKLQPGDELKIKEKMHFVLENRKCSQPLASGTAGCTFKNYKIKDHDEKARLEKDSNIPAEMLTDHTLSAGWLIDQLDLKGKRIGGAYVSDEHANFIINDGSATADDIVQLISFIKMKVRNEFGVQLEEEIQYIGF